MDIFLTFLYEMLFDAKKSLREAQNASKQPRVGYSLHTIEELMAEAKVSVEIAGKVGVTAKQFIDAADSFQSRMFALDIAAWDRQVRMYEDIISEYMEDRYAKL